MSHPSRGFSLIDVIVGIALTLVLFLSLFGLLRASVVLSTFAKGSAGATALAETEMEYLRGLSYDKVGTVGGIPPGAVPQMATTTENGITYVTDVFISYVDDPADGTGANDTDGITTDYKRARVAVSYTVSGKTHSVVLVSNFVPPGIETSTGGGTLTLHVVNANGADVPGATVRIVNASTSPAVDLSTLSDANGLVTLGGAATSTQYQAFVSMNGYSSAETYAQTAVNANPAPGYLTVAKDQTTTQTFAIDLLAHLNVITDAPIATSTFTDSFADASKIAALASTTVSGGAITLMSGQTSGSARSVATSSPHLVSWGMLVATTTVPANTSERLHVYDGNGALVPDTVLPGNSIGFATFPVSLAGISTTTYPSLAVGATLGGDGSATPAVDAWSFSSTEGPFPIPNVAFTLTGAKTIGSRSDGTPIPKAVVNTSTGSDGVRSLALEWDSYEPSVPDYDVEDACPAPPYALAPGASENVSLFLVAKTADNLRVLVTDSTGAVVPGASVTLARSGYTKTVKSSSCGSAYFGGLSAANDYTVTIAKSGYTTTTVSNVSVSGASTTGASFP